MCESSHAEIIEETIDGFNIYIEPNPDHHSEGYVWSVSKNNEELDTGLVFTIDDALAEIHSFIFINLYPVKSKQ